MLDEILNIPEWFERFGTASVAFFAALVTALVAIRSFRTNAAVNLRNKRADVIMHCNNRYDELYKLRVQLEHTEDSDMKDYEVKSYFRRYWGLKSDQLDYWFAGFVDPETLSSWFMSTIDALSKDKKTKKLPSVGGITYIKSWENIQSEHDAINPRLVQIMVALPSISSINDRKERYMQLLTLLEHIERLEARLISRLSRDNHKRMMMSELYDTLVEPMRSEMLGTKGANRIQNGKNRVFPFNPRLREMAKQVKRSAG